MTRVLLYDADCAFCTRVVQWVPRLGGRIDLIPYQQWPHLAEHGITEQAAGEALHAVVDGRVLVGHAAVAGALGTSRYAGIRGVGRIIASRPVAPVAARVYRWVAAHRGQLPGGTAACAIEEPRP